MTFRQKTETYFGPERMSNCTSFMILHMRRWGEEQGRDLVFVPPQPLTHVDPPLPKIQQLREGE